MSFVDEYIRGEAALTKRIIASIFFDTIITIMVILAHWSIKKVLFFLEMENELSWIDNISQNYYYAIFLILFTITIVRLLKSEETFKLSLNPFKQEKSNSLKPLEDTQTKNGVEKSEI